MQNPPLIRPCFVALFGAALASAQTRPADESLDWLLSQATSAPAAQDVPTTAPSPLVTTGLQRNTRRAVLTLSDGSTLQGNVNTTPGRPVRVWDDQKKEYLDVPFSRLKVVEANLLWERDEPEWQFKQAGSDDKVFSGKTYPARELSHTVTLTNGTTIHGGVVAPIEFTDETTGESKLFVLHKRDKGEPGQKLHELVYVKTIEFK